MFDASKEEKDSLLTTAIEDVYREMAGSEAHSDDYSKMADQLVKLYSLKHKPKRVSPDTVAIVIGNIIGVLLIVGHERTHIVTSKALNLLIKTH